MGWSAGPSLGNRAPSSAQTGDHPLEARNEFLPTVARALVVRLLLGPETRLLQAQEHAGFGRRQRPGDDGLEAIRGFLARGVPAVGEPLQGLDHEDLAVDHA